MAKTPPVGTTPSSVIRPSSSERTLPSSETATRQYKQYDLTPAEAARLERMLRREENGPLNTAYDPNIEARMAKIVAAQTSQEEAPAPKQQELPPRRQTAMLPAPDQLPVIVSPAPRPSSSKTPPPPVSRPATTPRPAVTLAKGRNPTEVRGANMQPMTAEDMQAVQAASMRRQEASIETNLTLAQAVPLYLEKRGSDPVAAQNCLLAGVRTIRRMLPDEKGDDLKKIHSIKSKPSKLGLSIPMKDLTTFLDALIRFVDARYSYVRFFYQKEGAGYPPFETVQRLAAFCFLFPEYKENGITAAGVIRLLEKEGAIRNTALVVISAMPTKGVRAKGRRESSETIGNRFNVFLKALEDALEVSKQKCLEIYKADVARMGLPTGTEQKAPAQGVWGWIVRLFNWRIF